MIEKLTLFDLFSEASLAAMWPRIIQPITGFIANWPPPDFPAWLGNLNNGVDLTNVRTGAVGDRVSVEAQLQLNNNETSYTDGFPFVIAQMPDVEFRILTINAANKFVQLFASASDRGAEVVLEGLPVEIRLPGGLVEPPAGASPDPAGVSVGSFTAGNPDDLQVTYRLNGPTSVFVHIRLHLTEDGEISVRPAVPISFGKCFLSGIPCLAVHDFSLIPSPTLVPADVEWIRHAVTPFIETTDISPKGLFAARSLHLDSKEEPFKDASNWLNGHSTTEPAAEFVLDDVVVPFYSIYVVPIPRHITIGIRRRVIDPLDTTDLFAFEKAPVHTHISNDPAVGLIVNSLFYKSLPSEDLSTDLGVSFSAAIFFGEDDSAQHAFELSLGENYTLRIGYLRDFGADGLPAPGTGAAATINAALHWEIATITIDIMAIRLGYSLGRAIGEDKGFGDCAEATVDLFVSMPPTGGADSFFKLRALDGQPVKFAIEGLGWRQGSFSFEGLSIPDGVVAMFGPVKIILQEIALIAEQGASYLSFTAGVAFPLPSGFEGSIVVKRMRFNVAGNEDAPFFKMDGFFARIKSSTVLIEAGGYFTEKQEGDTLVREFGLTGTVGFKLSAIEYVFGLDLLVGSIKSPADSFDYFMFQVFFRGSVMIAWFELRGVRVLFANNMQPKLAPVDKESHDLRYYNWYKSSNPINVPGDRRLAAWQAQKGSWALGIGVGASIAGLGKALELGVFVLLVFGDDENGFLIVGEVLALQNPTPIGFFALEWDGKNDRFSLVIGVNLTIKNFIRDAPAWLDNIARLTGTIFISNDPGTFAIGKLADERTWLSLRFDIDLWVRTFIFFGFCFEYVEGPTGPKGTGLVVRMEGGINAGVVRVTYHAGFGLMVMSFQTGSADYAAMIFIEAGLRLTVFRIIRFGISARIDFRNVGARPSRGELRVTIKIETPWFLPDITWTFEITFGDLQPADLATSVQPLRISSVSQPLTEQSLPVHIERFHKGSFAQAWNGQGTAPTYSVNEMQAFNVAEATRLARFKANTDIQPVATDSTIAIEWSVAVNDKLGLSGAVAPNLGDQSSGDLTLKYDFVGLAVRRRARFGSDLSWKTLEERTELEADFSDPNGVDLTGSFGPQELNKFWDPTVQIGGQPGTKKLLLNSTTPFEFQTVNNELDEELISNNPAWPCCDPRKKRYISFKIHRLNFYNEQPGADILTPRLFTESHSQFTFLRPAYVRPQQFNSSLPPGQLVAYVETRLPGPVFRAEFDDDVAFCSFTISAPKHSQHSLALLAYDAQGERVGGKVFPLAAINAALPITLPAQGPIRRVDGVIIPPKSDSFPGSVSLDSPQRPPAQLEVDQAAYVGLRDWLEYLVQNEACDPDSDDFKDAYEGRGKLFFLPNHEYEIAVTTRITVAHPSKSAEPADVKEYIYFKTKGLPGLNAVNRAGEEVQPYVRSAYSGGKGALYREEPVTLAFKEDFHVAVPLALRPPGTSEEHTTLLRMQLLVQPDTATELDTPFTATSEDWITAHRAVFLPVPIVTWKAATTVSSAKGTAMISADAFRGRLASITQREGAICPLADPRNVVGTALIAPPQGATDPDDPTKELWPGLSRMTAAVRLEGAGFTDRRGFQQSDQTAFSRALDGAAGDGSAWTVTDGELRVSGSNVRRFAIFGEPTWNHLSIQTAITPTTQFAGVGLSLPAGGVPSRGLFVVIETAGATRNLSIYKRESGTAFNKITGKALPGADDPTAPISLQIIAYDDKLRASVGETTVEVEREEFREGRLCLIARGNAAFTSLQVTGLDIYTFPFQVSRFRSFRDHIESYDGTLDVIAPNSLGPGTTTATTSGLYGATQAEIQTAMNPASDPARRQAVFDRWVRELGLPLKDELTSLELSRFEASSKTEFFLVESPEPLDFTQEVKVALARRVKKPFVPPWFDKFADIFSDITATFDIDKFKLSPIDIFGRKPVERKTDRLARARKERKRLRDELFLPESAIEERAIEISGEESRKPATSLFMKDVIRQEDGLRVELDSGALPHDFAGKESMVFVEAKGSGDERMLIYYEGKIERQRGGGRVAVHARKSQELKVKGKGGSFIIKELAELEPGAIVAIKPDFSGIIDWFQPKYVYEAVETRIIQDGAGRRAIIIPVSGAASTPLSSGTYRITFTIERIRWETTDAPDDLNRYKRTATLVLSF